MKILLVEDDDILASSLRQNLQSEGFAVDHAKSMEAGTVAIDTNEYDTIILDIGLPDGSGFNLLKSLRSQNNQTPTIMVSARAQVEDRVKGLDLGADDYLPKPVVMGELVARIRAVIRRRAGKILPTFTFGKLLVKPNNHLASVTGHRLELTAKEFAVLEYLAMHSDQVVTRSMIMEHVWGSDFDTFSNVIDVYIKTIRHKIKEYTNEHLITTIRGKGYLLKEA